MKRTLTLLIALIALTVNPLLLTSGCIGDRFDCGEPPQVDYSEQDIERELLAVPRQQSVMLEDGTVIDVRFTIDENQFERRMAQHMLWNEALAIGWVQSAQACSYALGREVEFEAKLDVVRTTPDGMREELLESEPVSGRYTVDSQELDTGTLLFEASAQSVFDFDDLRVFYRTMDGSGANAQITNIEIDIDGANGQTERIVYSGF